MRNYLAKYLIAILSLVTIPVTSVQAYETTDTRPNFVLILADDLGINDLHCYGRADHRTPNLDKIAQQGIRYTSAYCGLSICSASRAGLMTGKSPARLHLTTYLPGRADNPAQKVLNARIQNALPPEERTLAEELKKIGYRTGLFGKWHLGGGESQAASQGFEVTFEPNGNGALNEEEGAKNEFAIAKRAAEFIRANGNGPYFCYVPHHSPHIRIDATPEAIQNNASAFNPLYAANIESLDKSIGLLLEAIAEDRSGRETFVLFASDNGGLHVPEGHQEPMTHNTPFRAGKGYLYEGGVRVPLIVYTPKKSIARPRTEDAPVTLVDVFPTFLELAGVNVGSTQGPLDGTSLAQCWIGEKVHEVERPIYWNFPHYTNQGSRPAAAVRRGDWKLVYQYEDDSVELYNLADDIGESNDLAMKEAAKAAELKQDLDRWLTRVGAQRCLPNPHFNESLHAAIYKAFDSSKLTADKSAKEIGEEWKPWRQRLGQAAKDFKPNLRAPHGAMSLLAKDATPHGTKIRFEPEPNKNVIGYWTEVDDWVHWDVTIPKAGKFEVEVQVGCGDGNGGSLVSIVAGDKKIEWTVPETGHFQNMIYHTVGAIDLEEGANRIEVRPIKKSNFAIMDIRKIVLRRVTVGEGSSLKEEK